VYTNLNKRKCFFIAGLFGILQGLMPLIGYWIVELITYYVSQEAAESALNIVSKCITWISFCLLTIIGIKMIIDAIKEIKKAPELKQDKLFSYKEVFLLGIVTSIDAFAVGISLHAGISDNSTVWLHLLIIICITFVICLLGVFLGKFFVKLFKGKYEITNIIGGVILIALAIWIVLESYL